jgi:hypothetical protein
LTDRDRAILHAVGRMAQATTDQLCRLFFSEVSTASRRLAKLVAASLLDVHVCDPSAPNVYTVSPRGLRLLTASGADALELHRSRVGRHLDEHLRAINDVRVEFVLAARRHSALQVDAFHADLDLRRAAGTQIPAFLPDAVVELSLAWGHLALVLEVDTGSEGASVFAGKVDATVSLWRANGKCWGAAPGSWRPAVFVPTENRARALAKAIVEHGGGPLWLMAEAPRVRQAGMVGAVFATAEAVAATPRQRTLSYVGSLVAGGAVEP